jgi:hypothetical protein
MGKMVRAGAGSGNFDKLEPELEPDKNGPAPQHWMGSISKNDYTRRNFFRLSPIVFISLGITLGTFQLFGRPIHCTSMDKAFKGDFLDSYW